MTDEYDLHTTDREVFDEALQALKKQVARHQTRRANIAAAGKREVELDITIDLKLTHAEALLAFFEREDFI